MLKFNFVNFRSKSDLISSPKFQSLPSLLSRLKIRTKFEQKVFQHFRPDKLSPKTTDIPSTFPPSVRGWTTRRRSKTVLIEKIEFVKKVLIEFVKLRKEFRSALESRHQSSRIRQRAKQRPSKFIDEHEKKVHEGGYGMFFQKLWVGGPRCCKHFPKRMALLIKKNYYKKLCESLNLFHFGYI